MHVGKLMVCERRSNDTYDIFLVHVTASEFHRHCEDECQRDEVSDQVEN